MAEANVYNAATFQWVNAAAIANVTGGATVDAEARTATNALLAALRNKGVIAGSTHVHVGMVWNGATGQNVLGAGVTNPSGGATVDANARTAITSALGVLRSAGAIAGATSAVGNPVFDEDEFKWAVGAAIADVSAGATIDAETRTAVNAALAAMRKRGLIATD